jgi:hypothetical protein
MMRFLKYLSYITTNNLHSPELLNEFTGNVNTVIERSKESHRVIQSELAGVIRRMYGAILF